MRTFVSDIQASPKPLEPLLLTECISGLSAVGYLQGLCHVCRWSDVLCLLPACVCVSVRVCAFPWKRVNNNQDLSNGGLGSECGGSLYALVIDSWLDCRVLLCTLLLSIRSVEINKNECWSNKKKLNILQQTVRKKQVIRSLQRANYCTGLFVHSCAVTFYDFLQDDCCFFSAERGSCSQDALCDI